ncbi:Zn-ribbon domain-containing OB-fold protein [Hydrogenophaga sp. BPS33]|uniref:Zn-ribbon domain-containing OB-fold protein n=1 Tax=Hydrogenophaga sp. BPS33 TaxID=2651974 RepID=UPI00131FA95E|nr:OB-fold domain-containing protein [Hydrogenophaga sp. BPS33]QHE85507.1 DNA-binding protein [Hydrogenophaga sp. BPS33]
MTASTPPLEFQRCGQCDRRWYFTRDFCPGCGSHDVQRQASQGSGVLYTSTLVHRAPAEAFRALVPFRLALVDMDEGFRVMGHTEADLAIDDRVVCEMRDIAGRLLPYFRKDVRVS